MNIILKAAAFARRAHGGQERKYTNLPYIIHPARVAGRVGILPNAQDEMVAAAYLHDVLEDTRTTAGELDQEFGPQVTYYVDWLTNKSKGTGLSRAQKKQMDRERLRDAPFEVKQIKLLDRIDNLSEMVYAPADFLKLYTEESELLAGELAVAGLEELLDELLMQIQTLRKALVA